jgi:SpoVK/Ycf46/Vps4 family AAA+-type ATPase
MILDIHTKGWQPPVPDPLKDELAELTKGYGGADLRALCTEAALTAVQRRYPASTCKQSSSYVKRWLTMRLETHRRVGNRF